MENERPDRTPVLRSASNPGISLEDAIEFTGQLKKSFPNTQFNRDDIVAVLKRTTIIRDVAASVQYGLLEKTVGEGYKLSEKAKAIFNPISEEEKLVNIVSCFQTPKLYVDILDKYQGHALPPDQQFQAILNRQHFITEDAAPKVAQIFIENATFSGMLNENRILSNNTDTVIPLQDSGTGSGQSSVPPIMPPVDASKEDGKLPLLLEQMNGSIDLKIRLTDKKIAYLVYPENINEKDIEIMKLQIEALALTL